MMINYVKLSSKLLSYLGNVRFLKDCLAPCLSVKLNIDVAVDNSKGDYIAGVIRDWDGNFCGVVTRFFPTIRNPLHLEALGIIEGAKLAKDFNI